jgi:hypothetical protein
MQKNRIIQKIVLTFCAAVSGAVFFAGPAVINSSFDAAIAAVDDEMTKDPVDVKIKNPIKAGSIEEIIENVINFFFTIALIVCPLIIIVGGFMMVTSGGDPGKVETGKKMVYYALIGLGIVVLAKGFVLALKQILNVKK